MPLPKYLVYKLLNSVSCCFNRAASSAAIAAAIWSVVSIVPMVLALTMGPPVRVISGITAALAAFKAANPFALSALTPEVKSNPPVPANPESTTVSFAMLAATLLADTGVPIPPP